MKRPSRTDQDTIFETVTFDLFGTLVQVDEDRLPRMNVDGISKPSLLAAPFNRLLELVPAVDLGDALVAYAQVWAEFRERLAANLDRETPAHRQFAECLQRIGIVDDALACELARSQMQAAIAATRTTDGAIELLNRLRDRGCALGLVSNLADAQGGYALLTQLDLAKYFVAVVFSGDAGWRKPNRKIFEMALSALDAEAPEALHVGDELRADIWGAGQCGLSTIWVNSKGAKFEGEYPPRLQLDRLAALTESPLFP
jgi:HAD superfamily hydrolase (TIGR01549 family)